MVGFQRLIYTVVGVMGAGVRTQNRCTALRYRGFESHPLRQHSS